MSRRAERHGPATERLFVRLEGDGPSSPESDVPAAALRELELHHALRTLAPRLMVYREHLTEPLTERVLPDGACRLIAHLDDASGPRILVAGPTLAPIVVRQVGQVHGLSLTLGPGACAALFGVPASALAERTVRLDELWGPPARALLDELVEAPHDEARARRLERALLERLDQSAAGGSSTTRRGMRLFGDEPARRVGEVASALGVGERRLQQLFASHVGVSPRGWGRLTRLHACVRALRGQREPHWAQLATELGFSDQSHLIHEFRALTGLTPGAFVARTSGSSNPSPPSPARPER